jgi:hypothetical protein
MISHGIDPTPVFSHQRVKRTGVSRLAAPNQVDVQDGIFSSFGRGSSGRH